MPPAKRYSDLIAWQRAIDLVEAVYRMTRTFPKEELYGWAAQVRRAVLSVASNIAQGNSRRRSREFLHHLSNARASLNEIETQVQLSLRLGYINEQQESCFEKLGGETGRLMNGLIPSLEKKQPRSLTFDLWPLTSRK